MRATRIAVVTALLLALTPAAASADATAFIGATTTPSRRPVKGVAFGAGLLIVAFEFEYAITSEDLMEAAPSLKTGMGNVLLQTPIPLAGFQFYVTAGGGGYREELGVHKETHVAINSGGGAKMTLVGPLRVRLDYRLFKLRGEPVYSTVHRIYAGLNFAF